MPKVQAWELLSNPDYCGQLKMGQFFNLMLRAGFPEDIAQSAANERGWERLCAGVTM